MSQWSDYRAYWDNHARRATPVGAVNPLGNRYPDVIGGVIDAIAPDAVGSVYDIGCGPGLTYPLVRERWPDARYIGLDVSSVMIDYCRATYPGAAWRLIDGPELPGEAADLILMHSVFTHIDIEDTRRYLAVVRDRLTERGRASLSIHVDCDEGWRGTIGRVDIAPGYFEQMLSEAGLEQTALVKGIQWWYGVRRA